MHTDAPTSLATSQPAQPSLHQRRMNLGHLANRAIRRGLITDFIRTASSPSRSQAAGYAVQSPDGTWTRKALTPMAEYLAALIDAEQADTRTDLDCEHCERPEDRCSDESDRCCYRPAQS